MNSNVLSVLLSMLLFAAPLAAGHSNLNLPKELWREIASHVLKDNKGYKFLASLRCVSKKINKALEVPLKEETEKANKDYPKPLLEWYFEKIMPYGKKCDYPALYVVIKNCYYDINKPWPYNPYRGKLALFRAIETGNINAAKMLIFSGADVNKKQNDETSLIQAINKYKSGKMHDTNQMIKLLLNSKVNVHEDSPLTVAARENHLDIVKLLLEYNADVDQACPCTGYTSLHWAIQKENRDMTIELLAHDASYDKPNILGKTPLQLMNEKNWNLDTLRQEANKLKETRKKKKITTS